MKARRFFLAIVTVGCTLMASVVNAQVRDAFQDILPVTDAAMKKSLNGEWSLKVVQGISDDQTVNAAVSGQGPKFGKTAFNGWKKGSQPVGATFRSYYIKGDVMPDVLKRYFSPASVPAPFHPFETQYDTYLMRFEDIVQK